MYSKKEKAQEAIISEFIKRGYSIEKGKRFWNVSDSKLWYLTKEQAKEFIKLEKEDKKQKMFAEEEKKLLKKFYREIFSLIKEKNINIIDLGCGDGKKATLLINLLRKNYKIAYYPLDINEFMLKEASKNVSRIKNVKVVLTEKNLCDFLNFSEVRGFIKKGKFKTNIFLFLGGNLENSEVHEVLHEIRTSMGDKDLLIIGNKLSHPSTKKMVDYYNKSKSIFDFFVKLMEILGIKKEHIGYFARFRQDRVEMLFEIKKDYQIGKINFSKGDCIIVAVSYKYTPEKIKEILTTYFSKTSIFIAEDKNFVLAFCKK